MKQPFPLVNRFLPTALILLLASCSLFATTLASAALDNDVGAATHFCTLDQGAAALAPTYTLATAIAPLGNAATDETLTYLETGLILEGSYAPEDLPLPPLLVASNRAAAAANYDVEETYPGNIITTSLGMRPHGNQLSALYAETQSAANEEHQASVEGCGLSYSSQFRL